MVDNITNKLKDEIFSVLLQELNKPNSYIDIDQENVDKLFKRAIFVDYIFYSWEESTNPFKFYSADNFHLRVRIETSVNFMSKYKKRLRKLSDKLLIQNSEFLSIFSLYSTPSISLRNYYEEWLYKILLTTFNNEQKTTIIEKINKLLINYSSNQQRYAGRITEERSEQYSILKYLLSRPIDQGRLYEPFINHELSRLKKDKLENIASALDTIQQLNLSNIPEEELITFFELSIRSKHVHGIAKLLRSESSIPKNISKIKLELARKIYLEEMKRGDPSALSNLHHLINNRQHTEEMLDFLIYLVENDPKNAEYFFTNLRNISRGDLPKAMFEYLNEKVNPKGIKKSNEIEERFHLFITLYPMFFIGGGKLNYGNIHITPAFYNLDINTKKQIYYLFVNRRSFRNSRNKQTDFFTLLQQLPSNIIADFEKLIQNSSMGKLEKYLTKSMRNIVLSSLILKRIPNINSYNNLEELYKNYDSILSKMITESLGDQLNNKDIQELRRQTELTEKVLHLSGHYKKFSESYRRIYMEGLSKHLNGKHNGYKYKDLAILLKKYGKTTNLTPEIAKRWIKTMKYVRYPEDIKQINLSVIKANLDNIKLSISQKANRNTLNEVTKLLEQMENELYSLRSKDIEKRTIFLGKLKAIIIELNKNKEFDIVRVVQSIVTIIESANANNYNKFIVSDEFEFNESHDIGQKWGTCQSWTAKNEVNHALVASINDGTKKHITVRDSRTKAWLARGNIILGMVDKEFAVIYDSFYSSITDGEKLLFEFAKNKAEFMSRNRQKSKIKFYDAKKVMGKITLFEKEYDRSQHALKKKYKTFGKVPKYYSDTQGGLTPQEVL